jgi:hypothetical protein
MCLMFLPMSSNSGITVFTVASSPAIYAVLDLHYRFPSFQCGPRLRVPQRQSANDNCQPSVCSVSRVPAAIARTHARTADHDGKACLPRPHVAPRHRRVQRRTPRRRRSRACMGWYGTGTRWVEAWSVSIPISAARDGSEVVISTTMPADQPTTDYTTYKRQSSKRDAPPLRRPLSAPAGPSMTSRTSEGYPTMVNTISAPPSTQINKPRKLDTAVPPHQSYEPPPPGWQRPWRPC